MRKRYLPRSRPLIVDHVLSNARRAAATAASTSASLADAIVAMCDSSAGEIVAKLSPVPAPEFAVDEEPVLVAQTEDRPRLGSGGVFEETHLHLIWYSEPVGRKRRGAERTRGQSIVT